MELKAYFEKKKELYSVFVDFINSNDDRSEKFKALIEYIESQKILENQNETKQLFKLILAVADNRYRTPNFFEKLEQIISYLFANAKDAFSNLKDVFNSINKRILYFLLEKGYIKTDNRFMDDFYKILKRSKQNFSIDDPEIQLCFYLYPVIKENLPKKRQKRFEKEIFSKYENFSIEEFSEKCLIGQNETKICSLIRSDSIDEFIVYVNQTNFPLFYVIEPSVFETHSFLNGKKVTLIEYAAFYGSIQIVQYLINHKVESTESLWSFAIHSDNPEMIDFLENNQIKPQSFEMIFYESIQCHNNQFSYYIMNNYLTLNEISDFDQCNYFQNYVHKSYNYECYPENPVLMVSLDCADFKSFLFDFYLKSITIPSSITKIGNFAFSECSLLTQISIPSSVILIGEGAFYKCTSLAQVSIPPSITRIESLVFSGCSSLTQISIPSSVKSIGKSAFSSCSSLVQISIPSSIKSISFGIFSKCTSLTQITIPSSIQSIGTQAFAECTSLTQISIPPSVKSIDFFTFYKCSSLTQISIPSSVNEIKNSAFRGCSSLTQISIPSSVNEINECAFSECSSLKQIIFENPSSVNEIKNCTFNECSSLTQITIPSSVISIGNNAFSKCSSLTQISIPSSVTSIGKYAFSECSSLTQISIPSSVTSIGDSTFRGCSSLTGITIPSSVKSVGDHAFEGCSSLTEITIPSSVKSIGKNAFNGSSLLTKISFETPSSLKSIGKGSFYGCSSLTHVSIPSSVKSIGDCAFSKCDLLTQISIPSSLNTEKIHLNSNVQISRILE